MRIILSTALILFSAKAAFAAEQPVVTQTEMQISQNQLAAQQFQQPYYAANPYYAPTPVAPQQNVIAHSQEAKPAAKIDIMWMNSF